jgi:hypothetical protein
MAASTARTRCRSVKLCANLTSRDYVALAALTFMACVTSGVIIGIIHTIQVARRAPDDMTEPPVSPAVVLLPLSLIFGAFVLVVRAARRRQEAEAYSAAPTPASGRDDLEPGLPPPYSPSERLSPCTLPLGLTTPADPTADALTKPHSAAIKP